MIVAMHPRTRKVLKIGAAAVSLLVLAGAAFFVIRIRLRNFWYRIRYSQRHEGDLVVGDKAPDVVLTALDGISAVRLHERIGGRPSVLIFGSCT
jgi:hypothetical protein